MRQDFIIHHMIQFFTNFFLIHKHTLAHGRV